MYHSKSFHSNKTKKLGTVAVFRSLDAEKDRFDKLYSSYVNNLVVGIREKIAEFDKLFTDQCSIILYKQCIVSSG